MNIFFQTFYVPFTIWQNFLHFGNEICYFNDFLLLFSCLRVLIHYYSKIYNSAIISMRSEPPNLTKKIFEVTGSVFRCIRLMRPATGLDSGVWTYVQIGSVTWEFNVVQG